MAGIRRSTNRPKTTVKGSATRKKFRNEDPEAKQKYDEKMNRRTNRRLKKVQKRKGK